MQIAQLLDYLVVLERWSKTAWAVCKDPNLKGTP